MQKCAYELALIEIQAKIEQQQPDPLGDLLHQLEISRELQEIREEIELRTELAQIYKRQ